ncbi:MAG: hypothetical protein GIW98_05580 [Candidatus Eremiobacteraeota bacterium]|nr:hypothetical protein [Candidatus Eremiobacteraeota bacterium]
MMAMTGAACQCLAVARGLAKEADVPLDSVCLFLAVLLEGGSAVFRQNDSGRAAPDIAAEAVGKHSARTAEPHRRAIDEVLSSAASRAVLSPQDLLLAAFKADQEAVSKVSSSLGTSLDEILAMASVFEFKDWEIVATGCAEFNINPKQRFTLVLYVHGRLRQVTSYSSLRTAARAMRAIEEQPNLGYSSITASSDEEEGPSDDGYVMVAWTATESILTAAIQLPDGNMMVNFP